MDSVFPWGFPAPTAGYLTLYVATFALHHLFMHYVLAGSLYIGWTAAFPESDAPGGDRPLTATIREWLPFLLSAAITAGVAPLLFVQIVYPRHFYTANLLLAWKWMIVVPVLIVAFYLLYLLKSKRFTQWPLAVRTSITLATAVCFVFVGFCWTANHLLGNAEGSWAQVYASGRLNLGFAPVLLRMSIWIAGSFASLAVFTAWQLRRLSDLPAADVARIAKLGSLGTLAATGFSIAYSCFLDAATRDHLVSMGWPYAVLGITGAALQLAAWWKVRTAGRLPLWSLVLASAGLASSLAGLSVAREVLRLHSVDISVFYERHADAAQIGGFWVFVALTIINAGLIAWCIRLVRSEPPTS